MRLEGQETVNLDDGKAIISLSLSLCFVTIIWEEKKSNRNCPLTERFDLSLIHFLGPHLWALLHVSQVSKQRERDLRMCRGAINRRGRGRNGWAWNSVTYSLGILQTGGFYGQ